ncbi:MAG: hypothetical protein A2142_08065 [candidate division Zixibacteria bacterium RBG_16_48_11]|nr:MAG: hypothetical protein A2142_08065 [candidate division Zixibacteria bacterium RBG_16_48_11]
MKNQYFGDNRDLFKYDLVCHLMRNITHLRCFTFIPMLTENDDKGYGKERDRSKARAGTENTELKEFLDKFYDESKRDVTRIKDYFSIKGIRMRMYKESVTLGSDNRETYFRNIEPGFLTQSLVLVDPDIGLGFNNPDKEHLTYYEARELFEKMDNSSILMIYQHFPRKIHRQCVKDWMREFSKEVVVLPLFISDNRIIFFLIAKDPGLKEKLHESLLKYKERYQKLRTDQSEF